MTAIASVSTTAATATATAARKRMVQSFFVGNGRAGTGTSRMRTSLSLSPRRNASSLPRIATTNGCGSNNCIVVSRRRRSRTQNICSSSSSSSSSQRLVSVGVGSSGRGVIRGSSTTTAAATQGRAGMMQQRLHQQQQQQQQQQHQSIIVHWKRFHSSSSTATPAAAAASTSGTTAAATSPGSASPFSSVELKQKMFPYLYVIGNGAYVAIASGFLMTDMFALRCLLVGGYAGLTAFHALHANPLKIPLFWSGTFVLVNFGMACALVYDQNRPLASEEHESLYRHHFSTTLTRGQFHRLMRMATYHTIPANVILTLEGQVCPNLYFLEKGRAHIYHHRAFAAHIDQGGFINDIAFQQEQEIAKSDENGGEGSEGPTQKEDDLGDVVGTTARNNGIGAYGTVVTAEECRVVTWNQEQLRSYLDTRPQMDRNMKYTLSKHLMKSLLKQREARHAATLQQTKLSDRQWNRQMSQMDLFFLKGKKQRITHRYGAPTYATSSSSTPEGDDSVAVVVPNAAATETD